MQMRGRAFRDDLAQTFPDTLGASEEDKQDIVSQKTGSAAASATASV